MFIITKICLGMFLSGLFLMIFALSIILVLTFFE